MKRLSDSFDRLDRRLDRVRFLSGNALKIIAMLTMFVDHFYKTALFSIESNILVPMFERGALSSDTLYHLRDFRATTLYGIGRIAFPLFALLLTEGFRHTKNRKKYFLSMAIFALISELPFDMLFFGYVSSRDGTFPFYWPYQNIFFTLLLGLAAMWCIETFRCRSEDRTERVKALLLQVSGTLVFAIIAELLCTDYGAYGVLLIAGLFACRKNRIYQALYFLPAYMLHTGGQLTVYQLLTALAMVLYSGKRGELRINKYAFYAFYPLHLLLLYIAVRLLDGYAAV